MRRVLGCAVLSFLVFAACNGGDPGAAPATTTAPTSTTTTAPADPYAIPETIDVAYVQRVIDKLYEIEAEAAAEIVANKELVPSAAEKLRSIYEPRELNLQLDAWNELVSSELTDVAPDGRIVVMALEAPEARSDDCVIVKTSVDSRDRFRSADPPAMLFTVLSRPDAPRAPNPTPWRIRVQAAGGRSGEPIPYDPCGELPS